jgi:membrane fusion protein (multidrug efflux system)
MLDQQGAFVLSLTADNKVEVRRIVTAEQTRGLLVIESGLKAGELVIVEGQQRIRPGMAVTPVPQANPKS